MAIYIGFDEEEKPIYDEVSEPNEEERERFLKKAHELKKEIKIPQRRIDEIMNQFDCVVVQDFGDDYHLSEEEREKTNQFYSIFRNFSRLKKGKYRKLDKYVEVMREAMKCLDAVAEKNGVYDPEKFKKLYLKGKIKINGLFLPKYGGPNAKHIDPEFLADFILSDADPSEILPKPKNELITEEDYQEAEENLFAGQDINQFINVKTEYEDNLSCSIFDEELDDPMEVAQLLDKKQMKKIMKASPEILHAFKEIKRDSRNIENLGRYVYDFAMTDFEYIEQYDKEHNYNDNGFEPPEFDGDLMNDDDYNRYLVMLDEWEQRNVYDNYRGNQRSLEKINNLQIQSMFEEGGFNIMKFYGQEEKEKKREKLLKQDNKKAKKIKKKLMALEAKRERRKISDDFKPKDKKKKKGSKATKKIKKEKKDQMDDVILSALGVGDYKEYKADALDWRRF